MKLNLHASSAAQGNTSHVDIISYNSAVPPHIVNAWRASARRADGVRSPCEGPEWTEFRTRRRFINEPDLKLAVLYDGPSVNSVTPLMDDAFVLENRWMKKNLTGLRNSGSQFLLPSQPSTYYSFITNLFRSSDIDYLRVRVPHDDAFLGFLLESSKSRREWLLLIPQQQKLYYHWIDLSIGRDAYWAKFKKKQRYNFARELRAVSSLGQIELIRVSSNEDIDKFADVAVTMGAKTWQYRNKHCIANPIDRDDLAILLDDMRRYNMLRSYLLKVGGEYVCFWTAFQADGTFWLYDTGFDPKFSELSPGKCMLQLIINDLFANDSPRYLSFGMMADNYHYKAVFATNYAHEADVLVLRNTKNNYIYKMLARIMNGKNRLPDDHSPHEAYHTRAKGVHAE